MKDANMVCENSNFIKSPLVTVLVSFVPPIVFLYIVTYFQFFVHYDKLERGI